MIFNLVNDLLWNNKEEGKQEKGEVCIEEEEAINGGFKKEGIEENEEEKEDKKEEMIEGKNGGDEKVEECIKEEEDMFGCGEEANIEKGEDFEREEADLIGKEAVRGLNVKEVRRKGEELWLDMWGKEMERRDREKDKERRNIEDQRAQVCIK